MVLHTFGMWRYRRPVARTANNEKVKDHDVLAKLYNVINLASDAGLKVFIKKLPAKSKVDGFERAAALALEGAMKLNAK